MNWKTFFISKYKVSLL